MAGNLIITRPSLVRPDGSGRVAGWRSSRLEIERYSEQAGRREPCAHSSVWQRVQRTGRVIERGRLCGFVCVVGGTWRESAGVYFSERAQAAIERKWDRVAVERVRAGSRTSPDASSIC